MARRKTMPKDKSDASRRTVMTKNGLVGVRLPRGLDPDKHRYIAGDAGLIFEMAQSLVTEYNQLIYARVKKGEEVRFLDGLMAVHNFYRRIVEDLAERHESTEDGALMFRVARDTFSEAMAESEREFRLSRETDARD
jgi:hypothetical protein